MAKPLQCSLGLSEVWAGLWVGPAREITVQTLANNGITTVVWATPEVTPPPLPAEVRVVRVNVIDDPKEDLSPNFPLVADIFQESQGGLAIVCRAGISRSASLACAALLAHPDLHLTLRAAYLALQQVRPIVRPNHGFFSQLIGYEVEVRGEASVQMKESPYEPDGELVPDVYLEELDQQLEGSNFTHFVPL